jgi:hypothetical protein
LDLRENKEVTDAGIQGLTNLISLNLQDNVEITDEVLRHRGLERDGHVAKKVTSADVLPPNDEDMVEDF